MELTDASGLAIQQNFVFITSVVTVLQIFLHQYYRKVTKNQEEELFHSKLD